MRNEANGVVDKWLVRCNCALLVGALGALGCSGTTDATPSPASGGSSSGSGGTGVGGSSGSSGVSTGGAAASSGSSSGGVGATGGAQAGIGGGTSGTGGVSGGGVGGGGAVSGGGGVSGTAGSGATGGVAGAAGGGNAGGAGASGGKGGVGGIGGTAGGAGTGTGGMENTGTNCPLPAMPAISGLPSVAALPDPFKMASGTRITTRADWRCRRAEIAARIQHYELGQKPPPPQNLTATFSGTMLTVNVMDGSGSIRLTSTVTTPSGTGPFPAVIGVSTGGTGSLPASIFTSRGIATITFSDSQIAPQFPNRGQGAFYSLYPDPKVGAMIAWAWGISRIIDGLTRTASMNKIDVSRLAVTGCSYAGKIALYAGAFDERIALTIPQESGGGGEMAWRVAATQTGTEDLEHAQGTAWYHQDFASVRNADAPKLPFDQHELAAMVAPRALLTIGNPDIAYLGTEAGYVSMKAASEVWKALGVPDRVGYSLVGGHGHCAFPTSQTADVVAFVEKVLLGMNTNTSVAKSPYTTSLTRWIDWQTPTLN